MEIPLLDFPSEYLVGDASGKILNEYGRFPCKLKCGVYAFMLSGHAEATINIDRCEFNAGDLIVVEPGTFLLIHEFSDDALIYYVGFSASFLNKQVYGQKATLQSLHWDRPAIALSSDIQDLCKSAIELLFKSMNCEPSMLTASMMVHVYSVIQQLLIDITREADQHASPRIHSRKQEMARQFTDMVFANYQKQHQLTFYADQLHVTLPHLCTTVKEVTGKTASSFITDAILVDAKSQLKITDLPIKEIAISLGFDNVMFFNKYFKSHVGMSPKAYRNG